MDGAQAFGRGEVDVVDEAADCPVVRVDFAGTTRRAYNAADAAGR
jgi:hypothetical protein